MKLTLTAFAFLFFHGCATIAVNSDTAFGKVGVTYELPTKFAK